MPTRHGDRSRKEAARAWESGGADTEGAVARLAGEEESRRAGERVSGLGELEAHNAYDHVYISVAVMQYACLLATHLAFTS